MLKYDQQCRNFGSGNFDGCGGFHDCGHGKVDFNVGWNGAFTCNKNRMINFYFITKVLFRK